MPFKTYSSGMRSKLSFGVSMGIPFDTYLVDEVMSVGDGSFREKAPSCSPSGGALQARSWSPILRP